MAAQENHIEIVRILLANHARQDLQTNVRTPAFIYYLFTWLVNRIHINSFYNSFYNLLHFLPRDATQSTVLQVVCLSVRP